MTGKGVVIDEWGNDWILKTDMKGSGEWGSDRILKINREGSGEGVRD